MLSAVEVWSTATGTWASSVPPLPANPAPLDFSRTDFTGTLLVDGRVLVVGGLSASGDTRSTAETWELGSETTSRTGSLSGPRSAQTATLLADGLVLVVGGLSASGNTRATAENWSPTTGTFSNTSSMSGARSQHTATLLRDGRVLVAGGLSANGNARATAEIWGQSGVPGPIRDRWPQLATITPRPCSRTGACWSPAG